jgi:transposase
MAAGAERGDNKVVAENERLHDEVDRLAGENVELRSEVESFARKIASLEKRVGKNSQNSSLPPSSDLFGRPKRPEIPNRATRRAMGRKPGKQPGAEGTHLAQIDDPDEATGISSGQNPRYCNVRVLDDV